MQSQQSRDFSSHSTGRRAVELHHGFTPRATQLLSVLLMLRTPDHLGRLAQINTGEGKSLIVAMLSAYHALQGKQVDVITTSTELSVPEVKKQKEFFEMLSLTVSENSKPITKSAEEIKKAYQADVLYGTALDFQGDILRSEVKGEGQRGERGFDLVIVDEVDSMLYDGRTQTVRLSSPSPAMNHLEVVLAKIWSQVYQIAQHCLVKEGQMYCIGEDFEVRQGEVYPNSGKSFQEVAVPVDDIKKFISDLMQKEMETPLRSLSYNEEQEWKEYKEESKKGMLSLQRLSARQDLTDSEKEEHTKAFRDRLENSSWGKRSFYLPVPNHLRAFVKTQLPRWIQSAIDAHLFYRKGVHYDVVGDKIVPVDCHNTGVLQHNMVWSDGLAQFLQIKEGLPLEPESVSTNFLSLAGYFKRYGNQLYGLTGTLGQEGTQNFLADTYNVDHVVIPPYRHCPITGNEASRYLCKEFPGRILPTTSSWYQEIEDSAIRAAQQNRAVLVICQYITQVEKLAKRLRNRKGAHKVYTYTGQEPFKKEKIDAGEIIVATNIAGRGTDLTTSPEVERHGGMHVCITFLPQSYRVELQNAGRTARQGKRGSAQLIVEHPTADKLEALRQERSRKEAQATQLAKTDIARTLLQDRLFNRFRSLVDELLPSMEVLRKKELLEKIKKVWEDTRQKPGYQQVMDKLYERLEKDHNKFREKSGHLLEIKEGILAKRAGFDQKMLDLANTVLAHLHALNYTLCRYRRETYQESDKKSILEASCQVMPMPSRSVFKEVLEQEGREELCAQVAKNVPSDVLECFQKQTDLLSSDNSAHARALERGWGTYERKAIEERWGLWLKGHLSDEVKEADLMHQFERFADEIRKDAENDRLIQNPYFYIQKGNELEKTDWKSRRCYQKAIDLDPDYSVPARYYKAWTLLTQKSDRNAHREARSELEEAKMLLQDLYTAEINYTQLFVSSTGTKEKLAEHLQRQINVLAQKEAYLDRALDVIEEAQSKSWHIQLEDKAHKTLKEAFGNDANLHEKAIEKAQVQGIDRLFVISAKEPTPWGSIIGVAIIGLAQIAIGCIVVACTGGVIGTGLIKEGVSDLIVAAKAAISGKFSWEQWRTQKLINLAIATISGVLTTSWASFKQALKDIKDTVSTVVGTIKDFGRNIGTHLKDGFLLVKKTLGLALTQGIGHEMGVAVLDHTVDQTFMKEAEEKINQAVEETILAALRRDTLIQQALALDRSRGDNRWQNKIIKTGIDHLNQQAEKDGQYSTLKTILKGVGKNVIPHAINQLRASKGKAPSSHTGLIVETLMAVPGMLKAIDDLKHFAERQTALICEQVDKKYKEQIEKAQQEHDQKQEENQKKKSQQDQLELQTTLPIPDTLDEDPNGCNVPVLEAKTQYIVKAKDATPLQTACLSPSDERQIVEALKPHITGTIGQGIRQNFVSPVTNKMVGWGMDKMLSKANQSVAKATQEFRKRQGLIQNAEDFAKKKRKADKTDPGRRSTPTNRDLAEAIQEIKNQKAGGLWRCGVLSNAYQVPVEVYDSAGRLITKIGGCYSGAPVQMQYIEADEASPTGHWVPLDSGISVESTGPARCFSDAALSCLKGRKLHEDLTVEQLEAQMIAHIEARPTNAQTLYQAHKTVLQYCPRYAYQGEGRIDNSWHSIVAFFDNNPNLKTAIRWTTNGVIAVAWVGGLVASCGGGPAGVGVYLAATGASMVGATVVHVTYEGMLEHYGTLEKLENALTERFLREDPNLSLEKAQNSAKAAVVAMKDGVEIGLHRGISKQLSRLAGPCMKRLAIPRIPKVIHPGKQGKHIVGHNNYDPDRGRGILQADAEALLKGFHKGKYKIVRKHPDKIVVDFGKDNYIGIYYHDGKEIGPTTYGKIHFAKNDAHISPASPQQY